MSRRKPRPRAPAGSAGGSTPSSAASLAEQAARLLRQGQAEAAERICHRLLAQEPDQPTALMIASAVCLAAERWGEAESLLLRGIAAHPLLPGFHAALARLRLQTARPAEAVVPLENCVLLDPGTRDHRVALVRLYQTRVFASFSEASRLAMLSCLADESLTHSAMHRAWLSLLRVDPDASAVLELFDEAADYHAFQARLSAELLGDFAVQPLFRAGLRRFLAADTNIERGLTFLRRWFFEQRARLVGQLELVCALSHYCYFSEYVFACQEDWQPLLNELDTAERVALLGCYTELGNVLGEQNLEHLRGLSRDVSYQELLETLLAQPLEERKIRATILALTPIVDDVSQAVQSQYEENPYPRWSTVGSAFGSCSGERGQHKRILLAGCGTGREAVNAALSFPSARVEAIDLSRASLAYGVRKARERSLGNLNFAQADLLALGESKERYDLIVASGVLHHLRDPQAGLRVLVGLLARGGILRVGLYSRLARRAVAEARVLIEAAGYSRTAGGIRAFRAAVLKRPEPDPLRAWLTRAYDFYSLSQCRDLVFHVEEHDFTLLELVDMFSACELSVLHVEVKSPVQQAAYRKRFPEDPSGTRLQNWHALELLEPTLFAGMYDLWLCRTTEQTTVDPSWLGDAGE